MNALASVVSLGILGLSAGASAQTPVPTPRPTPAPAASAEFTVDTFTLADQSAPAVAIGADEGFVVTWMSPLDGYGQGIFARRFDKTGAPLGSEFQVNTTSKGAQYFPSIASDPGGAFVIVWASSPSAGYPDVYARRFDADGKPLGDEFRVNTYTTAQQRFADIAMNADGFIVVWVSDGLDDLQGGVYGQRYGADGMPNGTEFHVNTYTPGYQFSPHVSMSPERSVIVWSSPQDGDSSGVYAQLYDSAGAHVGGEFQVNTLTTGAQGFPDVAMGSGSDFVVTWIGSIPGDSYGLFVRGFNPPGDALGPEFSVSTNEAYYFQPRVAMDESEQGGFIVAWTGHPTAGLGATPNGPPPQDTSIYAQRFRNAPFPTAQFYLMQPPWRGGTFQVNAYTPSRQWFPELAVAPNGRFVVVWQSLHQDASGEEIAVRLFDFPGGGVLRVDERASGGASNVNGVLEAGERVTVDPAWRNSAPVTEPLPLTGSASNPTGPPGPTYTLEDSAADYGTIASGLTNDCFTATGNCYEITVSGDRPAAHWDATLDEALSSLELAQPMTKTSALHVGGSFPDVPQDAFYPFIESIFHNGVTAGGGCGAGQYCGEAPVLRQQMAVLLLKSAYGAAFKPPATTGAVFDDVPASNPFAPWIEELARIGVTGGCSAPPPPALPSYCPTATVSRQQMAVFLYKAKWGPSGVPGQCDNIFDDVPCSSPFAPYIEYQFNAGIAAGCQTNPPLFCPTDAAKRKQMAAFLVKTFGLQLYGPD